MAINYDNENLIIQYIGVFIALAIILYVYPRFVFFKYLRNKSTYYKIFFCPASMITIISFLFPVLWLFNIFSVASCLLSLGVILIIPIIMIIKDRKRIFNFESINNKYKKFYSNISLENFKDSQFIYKFIIEAIICILVFIMIIYFSRYALTVHSLGFSDMPLHQRWVFDMFHDVLFEEGVYPFGMHFVLFIETFMFPIKTHWAIHFSGIIMNILLFVSVCCFLKKTFMHKETIIVFLILFLLAILSMEDTTDSLRMIYDGMHRLKWTLPQEFALWTVFVAPMCLIKIFSLNTKNRKNRNKLVEAGVLLFVSVAAAFSTHYYTLFFQFITCLCVGLVYIYKLTLPKLKAISLPVLSVLVVYGSLMILEIIKCEKISFAMDWGLGMLKGSAPVAESIASVGFIDSAKTTSSGRFKTGIQTFFDSIVNNLILPLTHNINVVVVCILFAATVVVIIWACIYKRSSMLHCRYLSVSIIFVALLLIYSAPAIDLTRVIESYRMIVCMYIFICATLSLPFDALIECIKNRFSSNIKLILSKLHS